MSVTLSLLPSFPLPPTVTVFLSMSPSTLPYPPHSYYFLCHSISVNYTSPPLPPHPVTVSVTRSLLLHSPFHSHTSLPLVTVSVTLSLLPSSPLPHLSLPLSASPSPTPFSISCYCHSDDLLSPPPSPICYCHSVPHLLPPPLSLSPSLSLCCCPSLLPTVTVSLTLSLSLSLLLHFLLYPPSSFPCP